jgi:hypothetical protein
VDSLYDLDASQMLIFLRHEYLKAAKDMIKSYSIDDQIFGTDCCQAAEHLESALETMNIFKGVNDFLIDLK